VRPDQAGLAAALLNSAQQVGGALGLAVLSAISTARANHLLASHATVRVALTGGFGRALLAGSIALAASAVLALWIANTKGEAPEPAEAEAEAVPVP
jgi:Zn-dependent alcohol dehydrogenase